MANFQLEDDNKVPYQLEALDADGLVTALPAGASVAVSSSDPTLAVVTPDAIPAPGSVASGFIFGQPKVGTVQISAAVTNADGSAGPTGAVSVDIVPGPAATISIGLGAPVGQ